MRLPRETIYGALFAKFKALEGHGFTAVDRRLRHWSDVTPEECPILFFTQLPESAETNASGIPLKWRLTVNLWVYVDTGNPKTPSAPLLNAAVDLIEKAIAAPTEGMQQRLGLPEAVEHCWIGGEMRSDAGHLGQRAVAVVPVHVVAL